MYEGYLIPGAVILFLVAFVCGLNIGMMLMQQRNHGRFLPDVASSLYQGKGVETAPSRHRSVGRDLRKRDFVLDFGLP